MCWYKTIIKCSVNKIINENEKSLRAVNENICITKRCLNTIKAKTLSEFSHYYSFNPSKYFSNKKSIPILT